jgi:hypothetical protein
VPLYVVAHPEQDIELIVVGSNVAQAVKRR